MRNFFTNPGKYSMQVNLALLLLRIAAGSLMLIHGYPKLLKLLAGPPYNFADPLGMGVTFSFVLVVFAEAICSMLLILGLATRFAAIPLLITMMVVVFITKEGEPLKEMELPLLYMIMYVAFIITGAGKYSLDHKIY